MIDKLLHLMAGVIISLVLSFWNPVIGLVAAMAIGAGKEIVWDKMLKKGTMDGLDFIATTLGAVIGTATSLLIINGTLF